MARWLKCLTGVAALGGRMALSAACTLAFCHQFNPANPKARGEWTAEATQSGLTMLMLPASACLLCAARALIGRSTPSECGTQLEVGHADQRWRAAIRDKRDLRPAVAWPTIALTAASLAAWVGAADRGATSKPVRSTAAQCASVKLYHRLLLLCIDDEDFP